MSWFVYLLRCRDGSLYTGITTNVKERVHKHTLGKGAKYTRSRLPVQLVWSHAVVSESAARKLEAHMKSWSKKEKEAFILHPSMPKMPAPKTVEAYIASAPRELQARLKQLRAAIQQVAPKAEEKISYGMPYYGYHGRLAYFRVSAKHIGLYIPPPVVKMMEKELKGYTAFNATIQFPLEKKLPITLIKKIVKARMKINEAGKRKKKVG